MAELITKLTKWVISISAFIYGSSFLMMIEASGTPKPLIMVVFCYGIVYWLSKSTYESSKKLFYTTLVIVAVAGFIPKFVEIEMFFFQVSYYLSWNVWALIIGVPVMGYLFKTED